MASNLLINLFSYENFGVRPGRNTGARSKRDSIADIRHEDPCSAGIRQSKFILRKFGFSLKFVRYM